jgi:PepSY-associated TM region
MQSLRKNIYKFHRQISILALLPVFCWTLSGLMHPIMSNFVKPKQAKQFFISKKIDPQKIGIGMDSLLKKHGIPLVKQIRTIEFENVLWYQVKLPKKAELQYFNAQTGEKNPDLDRKYAEFLARYFSGDEKSAIKSIQLVESFSERYDEVNRLLPAYEVAFDREDGLTAYIETEMSRLGNLTDQKRRAFQWIFKNLHSWAFIESLDPIRIFVIVTLMSICFLSAVTGTLVYGFFYKVFKPAAATNRRLHRGLGLAMSMSALAFSMSGALHIFQKINPDDRQNYIYEPDLDVKNLPTLPQIQESFRKFAKNEVNNLYLLRTDKDNLLALSHTNGKNPTPIHTDFVQLSAMQNLDGGCLTYVHFLANELMAQKINTYNACCEGEEDKQKVAEITDKQYVDEFKGEYGFVNKRLPVIKVRFANDENLRLYIEYATGKLSTSVTSSQAFEGFTFAYLHKFHFLDFLGKGLRDSVAMFFAFGNLCVAVLGFSLLMAKYRKK